MDIAELRAELKSHENPEKAKLYARFFKTGKGQYGEGDKFLGLTVPLQRGIAKKYTDITLKEIGMLLKSNIHEHRFTAAEILVMKYEKANEKTKKKIFNFYLKNSKRMNNWDIVDTSAPYIVGNFLLRASFQRKDVHEKSSFQSQIYSGVSQKRKILYKLAKSKNLWERRISIIATQEFIRNWKFDDALKIARILMNDKHDLIQKATGWMLREVGNRNQKAEEEFLRKHYKTMPRTMLRYAIEKFDAKKRKFYMDK